MCVYTVAMFEVFMSELLFGSGYGSLSYESLRFCIYCQKKIAAAKKLPFVVSESGYHAFDNLLNYQYNAN